MLRRPLVSIGLPVRNGERDLARALSALLAQDYPNIEIVISDNASTDETPQICERAALGDSRVKIIRQPDNIGAVANFRAVLEKSTGEYFMWAAADDWWAPNFVSSLVTRLEKQPDAGVAMGAVELVDPDKRHLDIVRFTRRDDPNGLGHFRMLNAITSRLKYNFFIYGLFRTELLMRSIDCLLDAPLQDRLFLCQFALASRFCYVDEVLHVRMQHPQPWQIRRPEDRLAKVEGIQFEIHVLIGIVKCICGSEIVPAHRKLLLPVALLRYSGLLFRRRAGICVRGVNRWIHELISRGVSRSVATGP